MFRWSPTFLLAALTIFVASQENATAQIGLTRYSLETQVFASDLIVRGKVVKISKATEQPQGAYEWIQVTVEVEDTWKGKPLAEISFATDTWSKEQADKRLKNGSDRLWFFRPPGDEQLDSPERVRMHTRNGYQTAYPSIHLDEIGTKLPDQPEAFFSMDLSLLKEKAAVIKTVRTAIENEPDDAPTHGISLPRFLMQLTGSSGDANFLVIPADKRLESAAQRMIDSPSDIIGEAMRDFPEEDKKSWNHFEKIMKHSAYRLQAEGVKALSFFPSEENVERVKGLLDHPALVGSHGTTVRRYFVREEAYRLLKEWKIEVEKPVLHTTSE